MSEQAVLHQVDARGVATVTLNRTGYTRGQQSWNDT
jgi:hypothetical protein